jgi:aspartate aminotransferase
VIQRGCSVQLSRLARSVRESATMAGSSAPIPHPHPINLAIGQPAEGPARVVIEAVVKAARDGQTRYGPPAGLPALRALAARDQFEKTGITRAVKEVIITPGGKPALLDALRCMLDPGDEVLVLAPYWPSFLQQVELAGGRARIVPPGPGLLPDPDTIAAACTERTRVIILNDPCNPTSRTLGASLLRRIGEVAHQRGLWILADQVYADLVLDGDHVPLLAVAPELAEHTVVVESFSKRFAMTGYRVGYACGPAPVIGAMTRLATASTTCVNSLAQHAAIAALSMDDTWIRAQRARYRRRRDRAWALLESLGCAPACLPDTAFYLFFPVPPGAEDDAIVRDLRLNEGLTVLSGSDFGAPGHIRLSCGASDAELDEAGLRLRRFLGAATVFDAPR